MHTTIRTAGEAARLRRYSIERRCAHSFVAETLGAHSVVIDLGMNQGEFATWIAEHFACPVFGAEPDPTLYRRLARQDALRVFACAVSGRSGSGILSRARGECATLLGGAFEAQDQLKVEVVSLEEFVALAGLSDCRRIDLAKVDIEGAELAMFEEASDSLLRRVAQFSVEFHDFIWPELRGRIDAVKRRLRSLGFQAISFSRDNSDVLFLNREVFDVDSVGKAYLRAVKYSNGIRRCLRRLPRLAAGRR